MKDWIVSRDNGLSFDDLSERLLMFAVRVGAVVDALPDTKMGRHVASQLVRSGTSVGPNYEESRVAESRADFIHKMSICRKELQESRFWIRLIVKSQMVKKPAAAELLNECEQLCRIIGRSVTTARQNASAANGSTAAKVTRKQGRQAES
jgi:four helix bundle protein